MADEQENFLEKLASGVKELATAFKGFKGETGDRFNSVESRLKAVEDKQRESQTTQQ